MATRKNFPSRKQARRQSALERYEQILLQWTQYLEELADLTDPDERITLDGRFLSRKMVEKHIHFTQQLIDNTKKKISSVFF